MGNPDTDEATHIIVYEGMFTTLITGKLNLSVPYYTSIRSALIRMGCIRQLRRGGGTSPSQWELIYEPTVEAFYKAVPPKPKKASRQEATNDQILQLSARIAELEEWQQAVNEMLAQHFGTEEVQDDNDDV